MGLTFKQKLLATGALLIAYCTPLALLTFNFKPEPDRIITISSPLDVGTALGVSVSKEPPKKRKTTPLEITDEMKEFVAKNYLFTQDTVLEGLLRIFLDVRQNGGMGITYLEHSKLTDKKAKEKEEAIKRPNGTLSAKEVFERKEGDCDEIIYLFMTLAREAIRINGIKDAEIYGLYVTEDLDGTDFKKDDMAHFCARMIVKTTESLGSVCRPKGVVSLIGLLYPNGYEEVDGFVHLTLDPTYTDDLGFGPGVGLPHRKMEVYDDARLDKVYCEDWAVCSD
ncbi:hypothetical protein HYT84_00780 [Candidatus Micrarchaeota archaeon]|nr:hypothetical protein [Candidatus Micrarchaeota archaeon]